MARFLFPLSLFLPNVAQIEMCARLASSSLPLREINFNPMAEWRRLSLLILSRSLPLPAHTCAHSQLARSLALGRTIITRRSPLMDAGEPKRPAGRQVSAASTQFRAGKNDKTIARVGSTLFKKREAQNKQTCSQSTFFLSILWSLFWNQNNELASRLVSTRSPNHCQCHAPLLLLLAARSSREN